LLGANFAEINAVSAWVPSGVVFGAIGLAEPGDTRPRAAWTFRGKPLPYLQENNASAEPLPVAESGRPVAFTPFYLSHLRDTLAVERATIPVEKTRGPILLVSGTDDQMWPSSALADIAMRRLEMHHHAYPFRHVKYEGAGHRILVPGGPRTVRAVGLQVEGMSGRLLSQGGTSKADAEAGVDAWRSLLEFLEAGVKGRR
jgi:pimeloyl-ACP methyl ester carboxylesterase